MKRRITLTLIISLMTFVFLSFTAHAVDPSTYAKNERGVYIHAFENAPKQNTNINNTTVQLGDNVDIYFAVDNPNKGEYLPEDDPRVVLVADNQRTSATARGIELGYDGEQLEEYVNYEVSKAIESARHAEPHFDLQGYTVKIYFDTKYFEPVSTNVNDVIDYRVPNQQKDFEIVGDEQITSDPSSIIVPGYMNYSPVVHYDPENERWAYVKTTIFLMENGYFPSKDKTLWYNLCKLPLIPKQSGYTYVKLEFNSNDDLELFAKNNTPDDDLNFEPFVENDGYFHITITDKDRPSPAYPDEFYPAGSYTDEIEVGLYHNNADECNIYYTTDGITDPRFSQGYLYTPGEKLKISTQTTIITAVQRVSDGKWSDARSYTYEFVPSVPYLFNSKYDLIPNAYSEIYTEDGYELYTADSQNYSDGITAGSTIYYTLNRNISINDITEEGDTDPNNGWAIATAGIIPTKIKSSCVMRLATVNKWGKSRVATYYLSVSPDSVTATPGSGIDIDMPVRLSCTTPGATIYYTTDGSNPVLNGTEYIAPITLEDDGLIKAVACLDSKFGDISAFWYIFTNIHKSGVYAFSPSGTYFGSVEVVLYSNDSTKEIEISEDGITWTPYDGEIMKLSTYTEFRARLKGDTGLGDKFVYVIRPKAPVFTPTSTQFTETSKVIVYCSESDESNKDSYELWYTTDGTEPTENNKAAEDSVTIEVDDYVVIKAVVVKDGLYKSRTITHNYGVVYGKPASPTTTLLPGFYERKVGSPEFTTKFNKVPDGIKIYYTTNIGNQCEYPDLTKIGHGTIEYNGEDIEVIDSMIINAIAVKNVGGKQVISDVASFHYLITPQTLTAAPSTSILTHPLVPIGFVAVEDDGINRGEVYYELGNQVEGFIKGQFDISGFYNAASPAYVYLDTKTGNLYEIPDRTSQPLVTLNGNFNDSVILTLSCELDGVFSSEVAYYYSIDPTSSPLIAPFASVNSGIYKETENKFVVDLFSVYNDADNIGIQWALNDSTVWNIYSGKGSLSFPTVDTVLYIRTYDKASPSKVSGTAVYNYFFEPSAPIIEPTGGVYEKNSNPSINISTSPDKPSGARYTLYYYQSTDGEWGRTNSQSFNYYVIDRSKNVRAYVKNNDTGRISATTIRNYIIQDTSAIGNSVRIKAPFDKTRISAHNLGKGQYAKGIQFDPEEGVVFNYSTNYTDKTAFLSENIRFDKNNAVVPTERMQHIFINAWIDGEMLESQISHKIEFVHLGLPACQTVTQPDSNGTYKKGTVYNVINEYPNDENIVVFYTTDGTDPTASNTRKSFTGAKSPDETLNSSTTINVVYFSACGESTCEGCSTGNILACESFVFGEVSQTKLLVQTVINTGGNGGGIGGTIVTPGKVIDNTRKYTVDIFGVEHPTHIGYINGYPDGSVLPNGKITREEMVAVLYRTKNHTYEKPVTVTGTVFSDVSMSRWSVNEIEIMSDYGVVKGFPEGDFRPANPLTRAEFAALICRFANLSASKTESPFPDVSSDHWAYSNIIALYEAELINGYEDGTFRPDNAITRAEVMKVMNQILGRRPSEVYLKSLAVNPFTDLFKDDWYYSIVLEATITHDYFLNNSKIEYVWENEK